LRRLFDLIEHRGFDFRQHNSLGDHSIFTTSISHAQVTGRMGARVVFPFIR
jgi:hypothetical protein